MIHSLFLAASFVFCATALENLHHAVVRQEQPGHSVVVKADGGIQNNRVTDSAGLPEGWAAAHPPLREPFFWYSGHIAKIDNSTNLLIQTSSSGHAPVIHKPSTEPQRLSRPLSTKKPYYSQHRQDLILTNILGGIGRGFFVESGAKDGESDSNTLLYELKKGWTGLLIEPNPEEFAGIKRKHRHAYSYNGCLSPHGQEETLRFHKAGGLGHITTQGSFTVQAQPLQKLLASIGRSTVDFWSLDIEGSESDVLHSTDFLKIEVGVMLIEMNKKNANNVGIWEVMDREGFQDIGHVNGHKGPLDHIFVNPKYFQKRNMAVPTCKDLWNPSGCSSNQPGCPGVQTWPEWLGNWKPGWLAGLLASWGDDCRWVQVHPLKGQLHVHRCVRE